jgi:hypothetical protein
MRYTLAGGEGSVSENIAWMYSSGLIDVKEALRNLEHSMIYDDASSEWGHKYNILTPFHNEVSIGVAFDNNNVYFVEDFENDYIGWTTLTVAGTDVTMEGTLAQPNQSLQYVAIYYDNPTILTTQQLGSSPYNGSYDSGTFVGMALPSGWNAVGGITITASNWTQTGQNFQINFDLSQAFNTYGKGVYTLCLQSNLSTSQTEDNSLTSYSVWTSE